MDNSILLLLVVAFGVIILYQIIGNFSSKKSKEKSIIDSGRHLVQVSVDASIKSRQRQEVANELDDLNDLLEDSSPEAIASKLELASKVYKY